MAEDHPRKLRQLYESTNFMQELFIQGIESTLLSFGNGPLDPRLRSALSKVKRHNYLPEEYMSDAYNAGVIIPINTAQMFEYAKSELVRLGIGPDQFNQLPVIDQNRLYNLLADPVAITCSQPGLVAFMIQNCLPQVNQEPGIGLELGSGSGYVSAVMAETGAYSKVHGVEMVGYMAKRAKRNLSKDGTDNVTIHHLKGQDWLTKYGDRFGPFRSIVVSAGIQDEETLDFIAGYLEPGGIMVAPRITGITEKVIKIPGLPEHEFPDITNEGILLRLDRTPEGINKQILLHEIRFVNFV